MPKFKDKASGKSINIEQFFQKGDADITEMWRVTENNEGVICRKCEQLMETHGLLIDKKNPYADKAICPRDWIITYPSGERWVKENRYVELFYEEIAEMEVA